MEITAAVSVIVGIVLSFSGVIFALLGANQRKVLERIEGWVNSHAERIGDLEKREAGHEQEIKTILKGVERIEKHINGDNRR